MNDALAKLGKYLTGSWAVIGLVTLLMAVYIQNPSVLQTLQLKTFDYLIKTLPSKQSEEIVIVEFGEKSVEKFGQWPFDRRDIANTIKKLRENNAGVIVAPILFSEKDRAGGDDVLANTIKDNGVILAQVPTTQNSKPDAVRRGFATIGPTNPLNYSYHWNGGLRPLDKLGESSAGVGVVASVPELDGVVRRFPLLVNIAGSLYPSLTTEAIRVATDNASYQIKTSEAGIEFVRVPNVPPVATDEHGRIWLSWNTKFNRLDATEIDSRVAGKTVILGLTIEGVGGILATPIGEKWSQEVQAQALQTILDGTTITRLPYAQLVEIIALAILLLILVAVVPRVSVAWTIPLFLYITTTIIYGCYYLFVNYSQLWDGSYPVIAVTLTYGHLIFNNFAREFRLKQQIKKQFGTYLSPAMVEKLQKNPDLLKLGGETRELSIMFTDVRGFTAISEHYGANVQGLTQIMNRYMTAMTAKILQNNGTLDKYIGDAQMAFWNAPLDDKDHAKHAVKTALEMLGDLEKFNEEISSEGVPPFGMGLGINSGSVVVGNMGSSQRFDYTCLGDSVNLASRLEGQSKPYHVKMVIGQRTAELIKETYKIVELDTIAVKGKNEGVKIYTVIPENLWRLYDSVAHNEFVSHYYKQHWDVAIRYGNQLKSSFNGELSEYYVMMIDRIKDYLNNPPNQPWDGIYRATSK